jgi:hypothetical protein
MKKLAVLTVLMLISFIVVGQPDGGFGGAFNHFDKESVCDQSIKEGYGWTYHFTANGKDYVLSYETYPANKMGYRIPPPAYLNSERIERNLRLYRLDDSITMTWTVVSNIVDTDYRMGNGDIGIKYNVYFSSVDDEYKTYVKPQPNGDIEMRILKQHNEGFYYLIVQFCPKNDGTYKIIKSTKI